MIFGNTIEIGPAGEILPSLRAKRGNLVDRNLRSLILDFRFFEIRLKYSLREKYLKEIEDSPADRYGEI